MRSNADDRDDLLKDMDCESFFTNEEAFGRYWDIYPPVEFTYIYSVFMELYRTCDERISFIDIDAWQKVRDVRLTQYEVSLIIQMNGWASDEIGKLRDEGD